ncbi:hypothetical protein TKK_0018602 [Trichogramma kaykai]
MEFSKQPLKLPVGNFDIVEEKKKDRRHGDLLPDSIRAVFCGPSNCGKTNCLLALITHPNGLRFENVYVYSKSLNQPNEHETVLSPDEALPNSLMIFDDVACEKQDNVRAYFCMGRHKNVDSFYLCQSYAHVPKHLVRDNVNLLVIFRQDDVNLRHIYNDHVNTDMSYPVFKELCASCWNSDHHSFLVIDKDRAGVNMGRYRKGFDNFAINIS